MVTYQIKHFKNEIARKFFRWLYRKTSSVCECGQTAIRDVARARPVYWNRNQNVILAICCDRCIGLASAIKDAAPFEKVKA